MRPRSLVEVVGRSRLDGDWDHHLQEFLDSFYTADGDEAAQAAMISSDPGLLGQAEPDAFIGGVGEHLARRWKLPLPAWIRDEARYLERPLFGPNERALRAHLLAVSPVAFRVRLIFTGPEPLQRARFPYHRGVTTFPVLGPSPAS